MPHPFDPSASLRVFDRYAPFTDLQALKAYSARPLRKSLRVNTLKMSVEELRTYAHEKRWRLAPVPWCPEGFFVDRPSLRGAELRPARRADQNCEALGKDLLHLTGHFYLQEAASMLPVALLDPKPGEVIFDMSAAPGSKTTQIAARMSEGHPSDPERSRRARGVLIANDVQEKRLWTLKSALYRMGVTNAIVTKKVGQWFAGHMTERFDRVLLDAPCTAQGTVRKDTDALSYGGPENIAKMARLQTVLLEAAVHAVKIGGRIVYSTCTLTPEENEMVVLKILNKFCDHLEVLDPRDEDVGRGTWDMGRAIEDSIMVQEKGLGPLSSVRGPVPLLRLWPQQWDTEGFFCAVLRKTARTRAPRAVDRVPFQEQELPRARVREIGAQLEGLYGTPFLHEGDRLFLRGNEVLLTTEDVAHCSLPLQDYSLGLPFGKRLADGRVILHQELVTLRGMEATKQVIDVSESEVEALLDGKDIACDPLLHGHIILRYQGRATHSAGSGSPRVSRGAIGHGLARSGRLKNNLPRSMILP